RRRRAADRAGEPAAAAAPGLPGGDVAAPGDDGVAAQGRLDPRRPDRTDDGAGGRLQPSGGHGPGRATTDPTAADPGRPGVRRRDRPDQPVPRPADRTASDRAAAGRAGAARPAELTAA